MLDIFKASFTFLHKKHGIKNNNNNMYVHTTEPTIEMNISNEKIINHTVEYEAVYLL